MDLCLVRHAESLDNLRAILTGSSGNPVLSKQGQEQAKALRSHIALTDFDVGISSPAIRALQTAVFAGFSTDQIIVREDVNEKSFGNFENRPISEYEAYINKLSYSELYKFRPNGGESFFDLTLRVSCFLTIYFH